MDQLEALATKEAKNVFVRAALRPPRPRQSQGADGSQSADGRADQDPGQARREVPAGQVPQGRGAWKEVRAGKSSPTDRSRRPGVTRSSCSASSVRGRPLPSDVDCGLGRRGRRATRAAALITERAGSVGMLHGPVVVAPPDAAPEAALDVATELSPRRACGTRPNTGIDTVLTRPQGLDRLWVRFGLHPRARGRAAGGAAGPSRPRALRLARRHRALERGRARRAARARPCPPLGRRPMNARRPGRRDRRRQAPARPGRA